MNKEKIKMLGSVPKRLAKMKYQDDALMAVIKTQMFNIKNNIK